MEKPSSSKFIHVHLVENTNQWTAEQEDRWESEKMVSLRNTRKLQGPGRSTLDTAKLGGHDTRDRPSIHGTRAWITSWTSLSAVGKVKKKNVKGVLILCLLTPSTGYHLNNLGSCQVSSDDHRAEWKLMCHFDKDLRETRQEFQVLHMRPNDVPEIVLDGVWDGEDPAIYTPPGYLHHGSVSDRVFLRMPKNAVHPGSMYTCFLPPGRLENMQTCGIPEKKGQDGGKQLTANTGWIPEIPQSLMLLTASVTIANVWNYF